MLSFSLLLNRAFIWFFIFILFFELAQSMQFSISPPSFELQGEKGDKLCKEIVLDSGDEIKMNTEVRWAKQKSKSIQDYLLDSDKIMVDEEFEKNFSLDGKEEKKLCFRFFEDGTYYGVVIFSAASGSLALGSWMTARVGEFNVEKESFSEKNESFVSKITGNVTKNGTGNILIFELILSLILLCVLGVLMMVLRRQKRFIY